MRRGTLVAGKYVLSRSLGEGAMGAVWAAENQATGREVALKLLHQAHHWSEEVHTRLFREARAYGRIEHPNVVAIYDVGTTEEEVPFLVMQLLRGQTLRQRIRKEPPLTNVEVATIAHQIASGLAATHEKAVVHRDLKPANVFLHQEANGEEVVKILDFGLSKIFETNEPTATFTGSPLGSPAYMSPEQARAEETIDHRADLWALGVIVYEMLARKQPFVGANVYQVISEIVNGEIPRLAAAVPDVDPRLDDLVARALVRDPNARLQSAEEMMALLAPLVARPERAIGVDAAKIDAIAALDDAETVTHHGEAQASDRPSVTSVVVVPPETAALASMPLPAPPPPDEVTAIDEPPTRITATSTPLPLPLPFPIVNEPTPAATTNEPAALAPSEPPPPRVSEIDLAPRASNSGKKIAWSLAALAVVVLAIAAASSGKAADDPASAPASSVTANSNAMTATTTAIAAPTTAPIETSATTPQPAETHETAPPRTIDLEHHRTTSTPLVPPPSASPHHGHFVPALKTPRPGSRIPNDPG